jgi:hypothetical protein
MAVTDGLHKGHLVLNDESAEYYTEGNGEWKIENGILSCSVGEGFIFSPLSYKNFNLKAEFLADESVNSGIFFSCIDKTINPETCYEANIWDNHPNQKNRTGALVGRSTPIEVVNSIDKWSTYEIKASNGIIEIWVNGIKTVSHALQFFEDKPIIFQKFGQGKVSFRNIYIQPLKS